MMSVRRWCWLFVLVGVIGCGSGKYAVEGEVVWPDGKPATELAGYVVEFNSPQARTSAVGVVRADGTFVLGTDKPGDGVPAGTYQIAITRADEETDVRRKPLLIPEKYTDSEKSGLTETIERGKKVTLKVERAKR